MRFEQPKTYDTFVNDKKALGINAKANELKRSTTNYFSDPDDRYDNRIREANADNNAEMVDAINSIRAQYDAQVPLTQKVFGDKEVVEQKGVDALKQISAELKRQGKGSLVNADGNVLFKNKAGELVDLDQGILKDLWHSTKANKGSIMAGVGGALLAPVTGGSSLLPVIAGGAVGSALGAAGDYVGNANDTGQNVDTGTLANLMLENAGLSVLGDGVGYAVAKGGKALINKAGDVINKSKTLKDSFGNEIKDVDLKQKAVNILNNTPLLGDVTSANHAPAMGDITRSIKAADAVLSPEELAEKEAYLANNKIELNDINTLGLKAKAYADDYANRTSSPWAKDKVTKAGEYVENKAKGTLDPQITKEQEIALNNAFADPSEMKTIADVIGSDDLVRNKAIKIIDDQAQKRLEAAGIDKNFRINPESFRKLDDTDKAFVSDILGSYVNATKSDYNQVVDAFKQVAGNSPLQIDKKGLDDAINSIVANYAKVEDRDKMRIALDQMAQEGFNINKAFDVRRYLNKAIRNSDYTGEQQAKALKEVLDDSMFKSLGDDRGELRALLKEQDEKYAQMKALKDTKIFNKGNDLLSDDFNFDKVGDLINKNNDVWAKTTKGLNKEQIAEVEKAYIRSAIKDELVDLGMNRKGFNPIAVAEKLSDAKFVSDEAKTLQKALFDDAKFRPNTKGIIDAIDAGLKTKSQGGSIATSFSGKVAMAFVARSFERLAKHIPLIGKQAGKKNLYAEAFLKAKTTSDALTDIMKNEAIPIKDRFDLLAQAQSKEIRSLIDDFMAKKEQAKSDLIKMDTAEGNPKNTEIKGDGFITKESLAPKSDLNVKMDLAPNVRDLSKITTEEISADLDYLASKHPEMFSKPSDVFRLIREIKNEPTHFFNNNRLDYALIVKRVGDNKIGKLAVDKESGEVKHATKVKEKDIKRLDRISRENSKDAGIIQTFIQPGSKSNSELGLPKEIIPKQTQELDKTFKNQKDKNTKTINASPHIASGLLGGTANGIDENGNVSPEEFAKGSNTNDKKYALSHGEAEARNVQNRLDLNKKGRAHPHETFGVNPNETFVSREDGVNFSQKLPELKEKRGIYNVTYNGKFSTPVYKDLTTIDDAIKYAKGDKSKGAKHISIRHLNDESKEGYVTRQELLSLGENIRAYLKENKEPFIDKRGGHIYEWEDKDGVRFRAVIGQAKRESDDRSITSTLKPTDEATKSGIIPNSSLYSSNDIITFYSDRNLKEPMKFENPKLKLLDAIDTSSDKVGLVKKVLLNKDISDGVKAKAVNRLTKNKISQGVKTSYISTKNSKNN